LELQAPSWQQHQAPWHGDDDPISFWITVSLLSFLKSAEFGCGRRPNVRDLPALQATNFVGVFEHSLLDCVQLMFPGVRVGRGRPYMREDGNTESEHVLEICP